MRPGPRRRRWAGPGVGGSGSAPGTPGFRDDAASSAFGLRVGRVPAGLAWGAVFGLPGPTFSFLRSPRPVGGGPRPKGFIRSFISPEPGASPFVGGLLRPTAVLGSTIFYLVQSPRQPPPLAAHSMDGETEAQKGSVPRFDPEPPDWETLSFHSREQGAPQEKGLRMRKGGDGYKKWLEGRAGLGLEIGGSKMEGIFCLRTPSLGSSALLLSLFLVRLQGFVPTPSALFSRFQSGLSDLGWVT